MILKLAKVGNISVKDARTLNYALAVSLATCEGKKNSNFWLKMGFNKTLWPDKIGKNTQD
jgi:hypothetical protein